MKGIKVKSIRASGVSGGRGYSVVVDMNGNVWNAGNNQYYQLGRITDDKYKDPIFKRIEIDE